VGHLQRWCNGGVILNKYMRTCNRCNQTKPLASGFRLSRKTPNGGKPSYQHTCKECLKEEYANDTKSKERAKWRHIKSKFKLSQTQWEDLFNRQHGKCAICNEGINLSAHLDHCHTTNSIRGILCGPCNKGLGYFRDDVKRLESAAQYLLKYTK
jgi:hypothetical protein